MKLKAWKSALALALKKTPRTASEFAKLPEHIDGMTPITDEQLEFKNYILEYYDSQESTIEKFEHMLPYEMWLKADEVVLK